MWRSISLRNRLNLIFASLFALWLAGLFPDYIAARHIRKGGPDVTYYDALGRRGFALASDHTLADRYGLDGVLRTAADRFPSECRRSVHGSSLVTSRDLREEPLLPRLDHYCKCVAYSQVDRA